MVRQSTTVRKSRRKTLAKKKTKANSKARINIELSPELHRRVKVKAAAQGKTIRDVVLVALERFVARP